MTLAAERVAADNVAAHVEVGVRGLGHILAQADQPIMALAAHQQRPVVIATLQVVNIGSGDLDGAQHLQAEQRQQRLIAQVLGERLPELVEAPWYGAQ
jgi:hypothetical protein